MGDEILDMNANLRRCTYTFRLHISPEFRFFHDFTQHNDITTGF